MGIFARHRGKGRSPHEAATADEVLLRFEQELDPGTAVRELLPRLEWLIDRGQQERARQLVCRLDDELTRNRRAPPDNLARIAELYELLGPRAGARAADVARALALYAQALDEAGAAGEARWAAGIRHRLARLRLERGRADRTEYARAIPLLESALEAFGGPGDLAERAAIWLDLGDAYAGLEEYGSDHLELAREQHEQARAAFAQLGRADQVARAHEHLGDIEVQLAHTDGEAALERGLSQYRSALEGWGAIGDQAGQARCLLRVAEVTGSRLEAGAVPAAEALAAYEAAAAALEQAEQHAAAARAHLAMGELLSRAASPADDAPLVAAFDRYAAALRLLDRAGEQPGPPLDRAGALMGLARIYLRAEDRSDPADVARAVGFLEQAGQIYADASASGPYHASQQALRRARGLLGRLRAAALRPAPGRGAYGRDRGGR